MIKGKTPRIYMFFPMKNAHVKFPHALYFIFIRDIYSRRYSLTAAISFVTGSMSAA